MDQTSWLSGTLAEFLKLESLKLCDLLSFQKCNPRNSSPLLIAEHWDSVLLAPTASSLGWENACLVPTVHFNIASSATELKMCQTTTPDSRHVWLVEGLAGSDYLDVTGTPATEMKSLVFPFSKTIRFAYLIPSPLITAKAARCQQGMLRSPCRLSVHTVHTCTIHSLGNCFCYSCQLKKSPTPMLFRICSAQI